MGREEFYVYAGAVNKLPCTVKDYVFLTLMKIKLKKLSAANNSSFSEIWWFYPSASSDENDRYVVFNYEQKYGIMAI